MKLSEALMLGSTLGEHPTNLMQDPWDHCLLGIACHALGTTNSHNREALRRWPWLANKVSHPTLQDGQETEGSNLLTWLCASVSRDRMTWDQAAEIVRRIEPPELEVGETRNEQADRGEGPVRASLEEIEA